MPPEVFCACGRVIGECDGSRKGCRIGHTMPKREIPFYEQYHRDTLAEIKGDTSPTAQAARQSIEQLLSKARDYEKKGN